MPKLQLTKEILQLTKEILQTTLQLGAQADALTRETPLMGHFPQLNSLTVMGIISEIEAQTGCAIDDQEISSEIFDSVGTLATFIQQKMSN